MALLASAFGLSGRAAGAGAGDWTTYLYGADRTGFNGAETAITQTTATNLALQWTDAAAGAVYSEPVEANGVLYWGSWDGLEHATNLSNGTIWTTNLGQTIDSNCDPSTVGVASTPTVATVTIGGTPTSVLFVGGGNGYFYALNASTGAVIWSTLLGSSPSNFLWSSPAYYNGSIYEGVSSFGDCPLVRGRLVRLDAATGAVQNTFNVVPAGCVGGSVWGSPAIDATTGTVYFATGNSGSCAKPEPRSASLVEVNAANLSFVSHWRVPSSQQVADGDFGSTPTLFTATIGGVATSMVGLENKNGRYYAFNRANISAGPVWHVRLGSGGSCPQCGTGGISPSGWDGTAIYAGSGYTTINGVQCQGSVRALDPATGAFLWQHCLQSGPVLGAVIAVPGVVVVGQGSWVLALDATTGATLFHFQDTNSGSAFWGTASIANGWMFVGNQDGRLYAFEA